MTLSIGFANAGNLAALLSEAEDYKLMGASPTFEVTSTIDPSEGANYSGGASYSPGLPLLPSNAGLAGYRGGLRESSFGAMTYEEAMRYSPAPMTQRINALQAGAGRSFEGLGASGSFNPMFWYLGAAALAYYWFIARREPSF